MSDARLDGQAVERTIKTGASLFGMKKSGKTTIGRIIADRFGLPFVDTDELIVGATGREPGDIIREYGVPGFMATQKEVILDALSLRTDAEIWATGGAVAKDPIVVECLRKYGVNILLNASVEVLRQRLTDEDMSNIAKPHPDATLDEIIDDREPMYLAAVGEDGANIVIDRIDQPEEEVAQMVVEAILIRQGA